jgi:glycosyltransferase involved in cell wall biosynthesis
MTAAAHPAVSVVVRCRNEAASLGPVLEGIFAQEEAPPFEVVAIDSGSTDATLSVLASHPVRVERLAPARFSYGHALNRGVGLARGDIVVFLSAHCRPLGTTWLRRLLAPFARPAVVGVFGRQLPVPRVNPIEAITTANNFPPAPPPRVRFSTANGAVRRTAALTRPFDEEVAIAEDHVWACALGAAEEIVYVPEAAVGHSHPMSFGHWRRRFYAHGVAAAYARARLGMELPWDENRGSAPEIVVRGAVPFVRLVARLARQGELRALAHLPAYALARTLWYARGARDGARRYAGGAR